MRRFITALDVEYRFQQGDLELEVGPDDVVTSIARETAERLGVAFVEPRPEPGPEPEPEPVEPESEPQVYHTEPVVEYEQVPAPASYVQPSAPGPAQPAPAAPVAFSPDCDILIRNALAVIPGVAQVQADVAVKDGRILGLLTGGDRLRAAREIDADGLVLMPGLVDPHIHLGIFAPLDEEMVTETRSALMGGVTTVGCFFGHRESYLPLVEQLCSKVKKLSSVDIIPHLVMMGPQHLEEMDQYVRMGITSFKVYMSGIPGIIDDADDGFILEVLERTRLTGRLCVVCVHAENSMLVKAATRRAMQGTGNDLKAWEKTHPAIAEEEAVLRATFLAKKTGSPVYLVHMSSREGIEAVRKARREGIKFFAETTSPYLTVSTETEKGLVAKMVPPFRGPDSLDALWEAMADGCIDTVGTDHVALTLKMKNASGGVWDSLPGYPAVGTHLPALLNEGVIRRRFPLVRLAEMVCRRPAEIFGVFPQKGSLLPGSDADLVLVDLNRSKLVRAEELGSRADFSLYDGHVLRGWPVMTIKGGVVVVEDGRLTGDKPKAKLLSR